MKLKAKKTTPSIPKGSVRRLQPSVRQRLSVFKILTSSEEKKDILTANNVVTEALQRNLPKSTAAEAPIATNVVSKPPL